MALRSRLALSLKLVVALLPVFGVFSAAPVRAAEADALTNCSPLSLNDARLEARRLLETAERTGDNRSKLGYIEAAYRLYQDPVMLYNLGVWWFDSRRPLEAADLLRRYLQEGTNISAARRDRIEHMLRKVHGPTGELRISGEPCSFVYVDRRLVGRLPLSRPLLLRPGRHSVQVEHDHRRSEQQVQVKPGVHDVAMRLPAAVVVLPEPLPHAGLPPEVGERIGSAAAAGAMQEGVTLVVERARDAILDRLPTLRTCIDTLDCQEELARQLQAQYLLTYRIDQQRGRLADGLADISYVVQTLDAGAGAVSVSKIGACTACNLDQAADRLTALVRVALQQALAKEKGTLEATSAPEAVVYVDGRRLGRTPFLREVLAGPHEVLFSALGYQTKQLKVTAKERGKVALHVDLPVAGAGAPVLAAPVVPVTPAPPGERLPRPRWRLITGLLAATVGVGLVAVGATALSLDGTCMAGSGPPCSQTYQTVVPGGVTLGLGAVLLLGGVTVAALPGDRRR